MLLCFVASIGRFSCPNFLEFLGGGLALWGLVKEGLATRKGRALWEVFIVEFPVVAFMLWLVFGVWFAVPKVVGMRGGRSGNEVAAPSPGPTVPVDENVPPLPEASFEIWVFMGGCPMVPVNGKPPPPHRLMPGPWFVQYCGLRGRLLIPSRLPHARGLSAVASSVFVRD